VLSPYPLLVVFAELLQPSRISLERKKLDLGLEFGDHGDED
jgi:hypothetical protein